MKLFVVIGMLMVSVNSYAIGSVFGGWFSYCRKSQVSIENQDRTLEFLKSVEGFYEVPGCQVHIDVLSKDESSGLLKAEILIRNSVDQEFYMPIVFLFERRTKRMKFCLKNYENLIHYEFYDRNRSGDRNYKRHYLLDVAVDPETKALRYIEAGIRDHDSGRVRWAVCRMDYRSP